MITVYISKIKYNITGFSVLSNVWLSKWSNSNEGKTNSNSNEDTAERDMYLGVYAGLGMGQGAVNIFLFYSNISSPCVFAYRAQLHKRGTAICYNP